MGKKKISLFKKYKWELFIVLFLCVLHLICNLQIKLLSFSSDEAIPLVFSSVKSGFNWLNSRPMTFYYGYLISFIFIPLFKIPFIYKNVFLFTQCILFINSIFHVIASVLLYKILKIINENRLKDWLLACITLASSLFLQFFIVGEGAQIESLFILCNIVAIYNVVKIAYSEKPSVVNYVMVAVFAVLSYINNSRAIVLIVATVMTLIYQTIIRKQFKKPHIYVFFGVLVVCYFIHKMLLNPMFTQYLEKGANNTDESGFIEKVKLCLTDWEAFVVLLKTIIANLWASNISTIGFLFVAFILTVKSFITRLKEKNFSKSSVELLVLLLFLGTAVLTAINTINSNVACFRGSIYFDRGDFLFYVRYMTVAIIPLLAIGMFYYVKDGIKNTDIVILLIASFVFSKLYVVTISPFLKGIRYGVNNSAFVSLLMGKFQETFRYGVVDTNFFLFAEVIVFAFLVCLLIINNYKKQSIVVIALTVIFVITCVQHAFVIAKPRSDYYEDIFDPSLIEYCSESDAEKIYVNNDAIVLQYLLPDKNVYHEYKRGMDLIAVRSSSGFRPNANEYKLEFTSEKYLVYSRCD